MSTKEMLHVVAEGDTPNSVTIPKDWNGLLLWAVGRFGGIIIATIMCAYALQHVYADMQVTNQRILLLMEARAASDVKLAEALSQLSRMVDDIRREAADAHRKN